MSLSGKSGEKAVWLQRFDDFVVLQLAAQRGKHLVEVLPTAWFETNRYRTMVVSAQDGTVFAAPGTNLPHGQLTTGLSVSMRPSKALTVSLNYDALLDTSHASAQTANVKLGYQF